MSDLTNSFTKKLEKEFPEKLVVLMGITFQDHELNSYLEKNNSTPESFNTKKFIEYLEKGAVKYRIKSSNGVDIGNSCNIGDVIYDTSTSRMLVYNGKNWLAISK